MGKVIAASIEEGGVGKTTTALNIGVGLQQIGYFVRLVGIKVSID